MQPQKQQNSRLTTRNEFSGRSIDVLPDHRIQNLFSGEFSYMAFHKQSLQRKFHPKEYLKDLQKARAEYRKKRDEELKSGNMSPNQSPNETPTTISDINRSRSPSLSVEDMTDRDHRKHASIQLVLEGNLDEASKHIANNNNNNIDQLEKEAKEDNLREEKFHMLSKKHNGIEKPLLILDVDNTILFVRFFSDEMKVGDSVTYFENDEVERNNATVTQIRLTFTLEVDSNELLEELGSEIVQCFHYIKDTKIKHKKGSKFNFDVIDKKTGKVKRSVPLTIKKIETSGCRIKMNNSSKRYEISFTEPNDKLAKLEPRLERAGMVPVDFIYEGFLVRVRPMLTDWFEMICDDFDIVIYTSANGLIYKGLLNTAHEYLMDQMGRDLSNINEYLWTDVLYRINCTLDYDENGKPYHHKDLTKFGCDLSRLIMVDNSPIVCHGFEPNFLLIKDFFGKDDDDDELFEGILPHLELIRECNGDIRYIIAGIEQPKFDKKYLDFESVGLKSPKVNDNNNNKITFDDNDDKDNWDPTDEIDLTNEKQLWCATNIFMKHFQQIMIERLNVTQKYQSQYDELQSNNTTQQNTRENTPESIANTDCIEHENEESFENSESLSVLNDLLLSKENSITSNEDSKTITISVVTTDDLYDESDDDYEINMPPLPLSQAVSVPTSPFRRNRIEKAQARYFARTNSASNFRSKHKARRSFGTKKSLLLVAGESSQSMKRLRRYSTTSPRKQLLGGKFDFDQFEELNINDAIHTIGAVEEYEDDNEDNELYGVGDVISSTLSTVETEKEISKEIKVKKTIESTQQTKIVTQVSQKNDDKIMRKNIVEKSSYKNQFLHFVYKYLH